METTATAWTYVMIHSLYNSSPHLDLLVAEYVDSGGEGEAMAFIW